MLKESQDAFGRGMWDTFQGKPSNQIIERDDGNFDATHSTSVYFSSFDDWFDIEKKAISYARGRVLDVGCGAGRHSLYLQGKGLEVLGTDNSPLALEVCRQRGLRQTALVPAQRLSRKLGQFDTILMLGNNFGLVGSYEGAKRLLKRFYKMTSKEGKIIAASTDPYAGNVDPDHLAYHKANLACGRMGGQVRVRVRYKRFATPYFDYLLVSKKEMEDILEGTGWGVEKYIDSEGPAYIAIVEKE